MQKEDRARIILGQVRSHMQSRGRTAQSTHPFDNNAAATVESVELAGRWRASIQHGDRAADMWNLLSVEAGGARKLAVRFRSDEVELVLFEPGAWETWFGTYDPLDLEGIRR